jgi:phosphatidylglycerol:prolipoprotein diacylglycerol transferase
MADLIAPSMMAGLALGRVGCLLNGCCYGGESTAPWAVTFPRENAPRHFSAPYADQAAAGRFYGFRVVDDSAHGAVIVDRVDAGSPAEKAGLHMGEVVRTVNGKDVASADAARDEIIDAFLAGKSLRLGVAGGEKRTLAAIDPPPRSLPVHPTQIYSAVDAGLLAWLLWAFYPYRRRRLALLAVAAGLWIWLLQKPPGRLAFPLPAAKTPNQPAS